MLEEVINKHSSLLGNLSIKKEEGEKFAGDIVLCKSVSPLGLALMPFTGTINHCSLRVSQNYAVSIDLIAWLINKDFLLTDLRHPPWYYSEYRVLRNEGITPKQRRMVVESYREFLKKYDWQRIVVMARRHLRRKKPDMQDISTHGGNNTICPQILAELSKKINIDYGVNHIHRSQVEPSHFDNPRNYLVYTWIRFNGSQNLKGLEL